MSATDPLLRSAFARAEQVVAGFDDLRLFLAPVLPAADGALQSLPVVERIASVALLKRYEQLQDLIGQLGRVVLSWEAEDTRRMTRRDFANWLEKLNVVEDADDYLSATDLRNRLVHEYPLGEDEQTSRVNASWIGFPALVAMLVAIRKHMIDRGFDFDGN